MLIKNFSQFLIFILLCVTFIIFCFYLLLRFEILYFKSWMNFYFSFSFRFIYDKSFLFFLFTVTMVTILVCFFREAYIEHYNNKKFFFLIWLFFISIVLLICTSNFFSLLLGWDGLGISSICLIIFYPNKITLYNSFFTMFFNRLGDVIFVGLICFCLINCVNFVFIIERYRLIFFFFVLLCRFTKSAQFPLSSWLPAAISAPTPISAMVHSSTLVTAGIFLIHKFEFYFNLFNLLIFLCFFRLCSFICGGFIANIEIDFKKIVAFSTMRQIRMIIYFCSIGFTWLAIGHVFFHALFKTLLFSISGFLFVFCFRDQFKNHLKSIFRRHISRFFLFASCFRMSGLIFSSSFYRKDSTLEWVQNFYDSFFFIMLILGRLATLFYLCRLIDSSLCLSRFRYNLFFKEFYRKFWMLFGRFIIISGILMRDVLFFSNFSFFNIVDLTSIIFLFTLPFLYYSFSPRKFFLYFTLNIRTIKTFRFSIFSKVINLRSFENLVFSDHVFIKRFYFYEQLYRRIFRFKFRSYFITSIFLLLIYSLNL